MRIDIASFFTPPGELVSTKTAPDAEGGTKGVFSAFMDQLQTIDPQAQQRSASSETLEHESTEEEGRAYDHLSQVLAAVLVTPPAAEFVPADAAPLSTVQTASAGKVDGQAWLGTERADSENLRQFEQFEFAGWQPFALPGFQWAGESATRSPAAVADLVSQPESSPAASEVRPNRFVIGPSTAGFQPEQETREFGLQKPEGHDALPVELRIARETIEFASRQPFALPGSQWAGESATPVPVADFRPSTSGFQPEREGRELGLPFAVPGFLWGANEFATRTPVPVADFVSQQEGSPVASEVKPNSSAIDAPAERLLAEQKGSNFGLPQAKVPVTPELQPGNNTLLQGSKDRAGEIDTNESVTPESQLSEAPQLSTGNADHAGNGAASRNLGVEQTIIEVESKKAGISELLQKAAITRIAPASDTEGAAVAAENGGAPPVSLENAGGTATQRDSFGVSAVAPERSAQEAPAWEFTTRMPVEGPAGRPAKPTLPRRAPVTGVVADEASGDDSVEPKAIIGHTSTARILEKEKVEPVSPVAAKRPEGSDLSFGAVTEHRPRNDSSAISSSPQSAPASAPRDPEFIVQLAARIKTQLEEGTSEIRIRLRPDSLGHLEIKAENGASGLTARIVAESAGVKNHLENNIHVLQQSLHEQGLSVDRIEVVLREGFETGYSANQQQLGDAPAGQQSQSPRRQSNSSSAGTDGAKGEIAPDPVSSALLRPNSTFHTVA